MSYGYYKTNPRGRGYSSRGSYRGRGEGTYYSRGSYRGRSNWQADNSSTGFDSWTGYSTGTSSRDQTDDSGYRRYSRENEGDYSSHDRSYRSESSRKRMRTDEDYAQAPSTHRTYDSGYEGGTDYSNSYSYSNGKEGYGYRDERRFSDGFRGYSRDEYSHRKKEPLQVAPSPVTSRYPSSSRGSFRGRIRSSIRGYKGYIPKTTYTGRTTSYFSRKRSLVDPYAVRKRIVSTKTQADTLRKLRILKLKRLRETALRHAALQKKDGEGKDKTTEDVSDEDEEDENEKEEEGDETPKKKSSKEKVKLKKDVNKENGEDVENDDEEEAEDGDDDEKEEGTGSDTKKQASDDEDSSQLLIRGRPYIKLQCPHCHVRCITFQEYNTHLYSFKHINVVRKLAQTQEQMLAELRAKQRQRQRIIDNKKKEEDDLPLKRKYCVVCELNYSQLKTEHIASLYHKRILNFIKPYCRVCSMRLSSPMLYAKHISYLDHIKRKALIKSVSSKDAGSGLEDDDDEKELDMENFMTLDSVGSFDDPGEETKTEEDDKGKEVKKSKTEVNPGDEFVKKVEVQYCELCHKCVTRSDKSNKAVTEHCRSREHLAFYLRYRRRMERIEAEKEKLSLKKAAKTGTTAEKNKKEKTEKMDVDDVTLKENDNEDSVPKEKQSVKAADGKTSDARETDQDLETDEKMWADVDKDLGDILREVEPDNKSSDEDDDGTEGGRYDRFKYSEKESVVKDAEKSAKDGEDKAGNEGKINKEAKGETKSATPSPVKKSASASTLPNE